MMNFTCQRDLAERGPDSWLNGILGVSGRVFLEELSIWISGMREADGPLRVGGPRLIS